jgi:DNA-binding response OmpR family regulator
MKMMKPLRPFLQRNVFPALVLRTTEAPLIYVVDDEEELTELYTILLSAAGYSVRAFTDRAEALATLMMDPAKPALLITDYLNLSMPVDGFILHCRAAHPSLRILMASGCSESDVEVFHPMPDRFIQKPFTPEELEQEVRAALAA